MRRLEVLWVKGVFGKGAFALECLQDVGSELIILGRLLV